MVPAIEEVAGTQYQCNITNVATSLDSVKQGAIDTNLKLVPWRLCSFIPTVTNFSFVSVEVGIPFATSQNALTIYNCSAAKRLVGSHGYVRLGQVLFFPQLCGMSGYRGSLWLVSVWRKLQWDIRTLSRA